MQIGKRGGMNVIRRDWVDTWPQQYLTSVTLDRARQNADYLKECFGQKWLARSETVRPTHPLIQDWINGGPEAFLRLNALAEDFRMIRDRPGSKTLLNEMKSLKDFIPTLHTLHAAAMLVRGGATLEKFFGPSATSVPDFEMTMHAQRLHVEAKQLMTSEAAKLFSASAADLQKSIINGVFLTGMAYPEVHVIIKDSRRIPRHSDVVSAIQIGLQKYEKSSDLLFRSEIFNLRFTKSQISEVFNEQYTIQIIGPSDPSEDERVVRLLNKANRQLRHGTGGNFGGVVSIAINEHHDPHSITSLLRRKFGGGDYKHTSVALVHRSGMYMGSGNKATIDLVTGVSNPNAHVPIDRITMAGPGLTGDLLNATVEDGTVSCYGVGQACARANGAPGAIGFNPIHRIHSDALA